MNKKEDDDDMARIALIAVTNPHKKFHNSQKERIKELKKIEELQRSGEKVPYDTMLKIEKHLKASGIIDKQGNLSVHYKTK